MQKVVLSSTTKLQEKRICTSSSLSKESMKMDSDVKTDIAQQQSVVAEIKEIRVAKCNNQNGQRRWDKSQYCLYCNKKISKIGRHLLSMHKEELDVKRLISLKDEKCVASRKEKDLLFEKLRKRGNFTHNQKVYTDGFGELVVEKRPSVDAPYHHFLPCEYCLGYYHKVELRRHMRTCKFKPQSQDCCPGRVQSKASMLIYKNPVASNALRKVIAAMVVDDVSLCVRNDPLIIKFGNSLCQRLRKSGEQKYHISNKMRELGRLVIEARQYCEEIKTLSDCVRPTMFEFVIQAVTVLCGWNEEDGTIQNPSIGIKLGHSLVKTAKIKKGDAIIAEDNELKISCDDFCSLIEMKWNDEISRCSREELECRKWNQPQMLPLTSDLQILRKHLKETTNTAISALSSNNSDASAWRELSTAILVGLILFNRRRGGEPAALEINDFEKRRNGDMNDEIKKSLSAFELKLCSIFKRIEVRGKRGRKVPLIITKEMEKAMVLLINLRNSVGVNPQNPFVFSVPGSGSLKNIRGPDALRKHVKLCKNLTSPDTVRSTNLRKHIATLSQVLNLDSGDMEMLARFLGHDIAVHKEYYRLPEDTLQLAKCSKLLLVMEKGASNFTGKSLNEIEVDINGKAQTLSFSILYC